MAFIEVTAAGPLSYKILKEYHTTARDIYDFRVLNGKDVEEEECQYAIIINSEDPFEAETKFQYYIGKLNDLGVFYHHAHLNYIVSNMIKFEGNYINDEAVSNNLVIGDLIVIRGMLSILETQNLDLINLEYSHKTFSDKNFDHYIKINKSNLVKASLQAAIKEQFAEIKEKSYSYSFEFNQCLGRVVYPTLETIQELTEIARTVRLKAFKSELLSNICFLLLKYLTEQSTLNPEGVFATNDQLRVIWQTCKLHDLLDVNYEGYDPSEINYIRSILSNRKVT